MKLEALQKKLETTKFIESEKAKRDLCGTYSYCKYCKKQNKYPCARAYNKELKLVVKRVNEAS